MRTATATLVGTVLGLAGCSSGPEPAVSPTGTLAVLIDSYLEAPAAEQYSAQQVAVLERAREQGVLEFEDYASAVAASLDCIGSAGFYTDEEPPDASRGFLTISYFYEGPETGNPVAEACIEEHSAAVEAVYQLQPTSHEAELALASARVPALVTCLEKLGIDPAQFDDMTVEDVDRRVGSLIVEALEMSEERADAIASCDSASYK